MDKSELTPDQVIEAFVELRDTIDTLDKAHEEKVKPLKAKLAKMSAWLHDAMNAQGLTQLKSEAGTAFKKQVQSVSVADWEAYWGWLYEAGAWQYITHAANKTAVVDYVKENSVTPPGINYTVTEVVQVNRARGT